MTSPTSPSAWQPTMWITVLLRTPASWLSRQECPWSRVGATEIAIVIVGSQKEPAYWPGIPDPEASYGAADAPHARNHRRHCSADADQIGSTSCRASVVLYGEHT